MQLQAGPDEQGKIDGEAEVPDSGAVDTARLLRVSQRRLAQIRAESLQRGEREWRELSRRIEQVLRLVYESPRLMADREIDQIWRRMLVATNLGEFNFDLRCLAERLGEIAGVPVSGGMGMSGERGSLQSEKIGGDRPVNGRLRLRL